MSENLKKSLLIFLPVMVCSMLVKVQAFAMGRDPTRPDDAADPANKPKLEELMKLGGEEVITLMAIYISKDREIAVINNLLVKEGDEILGRKVVSITKDTVVLQNDKEEQLELKLPRQITTKVAQDEKQGI